MADATTGLRPGKLGDKARTGTQPEFTGSMAEAIEKALNDLLVADGKPALPDDNTPETRDRRMVFVAIARGVVDHLTARPGAFRITGATGVTPRLEIDKDLS